MTHGSDGLPSRPRPLGQDVTAISALGEPARQRLYDYVCAQQSPVSRDEAAEGVGMRRQTAAFHLDKLADVGLLEIEFARLGRRRGPGAGRPSKLYKRAAREIAVQLPERSYELAGRLLAQAVDDSEALGGSPRENLSLRARQTGSEIGSTAGPTEAELLAALERSGYEPRVENGEIALANCPFHALVADHTELVCSMNLDLIDGMLGAAGCTGCRARLAPQDGYCCVRIDPAPHDADPTGDRTP